MLFSWNSAYLTAVVVAAVLFSTSAQPDQAATSLRYVFACFRHGIRSPMSSVSTGFPTDPNKNEYLRLSGGVASGLTTVGIKQMFQVGKTVRQRYGEFVGDFREDTVRVSSTGVSRTIKSALSVMAGMFPPPPDDPVFPDLPWQPVPVWQDINDWDKFLVLRIYLRAFYKDKLTISPDCPKYGKLLQEVKEKMTSSPKTPDEHQKYETEQRLVKYLQQMTGDPNIKSSFDIQKIYDVLHSAELNGLPLPEWATTPVAEFGPKPLYPDLIKSDLGSALAEAASRAGLTDIFVFQAGTMFWAINKHLRRKASQMSSPEKMRYHQSHDVTLIPLMTALGLEGPMSPGDGVIFELHDQAGQMEVKMLYYDAGGHVMRELQSALCPPPCSLDQFSAMFQQLSPEQWHQKCQQ